MSQKPAPSRTVPAPTRVSGGIPWWLWLILVVFGVSVVTTLVRKAIPEDPRMYVQDGLAALEIGDVPTVERSIQKLMDLLFKLRDAGNTVIVIEHNLDVINLADWLIDLGPGGGREGGELIYAGTRADIEACERSLTGQALKRWRQAARVSPSRK